MYNLLFKKAVCLIISKIISKVTVIWQFRSLGRCCPSIVTVTLIVTLENLNLRYAFEMRTLTVEPENDGSTLKVRISDAYLKCRAGYF